jgi:hypothetical protein
MIRGHRQERLDRRPARSGFVQTFAMIWHAAVDRDQTWVWYASGIVLGAAILALFAVFEKRRNDVLNVVDRFRTWN